ncbi:MAG: zf-HC2 domain-containing protein [Anaerolineales bacterium]
MNEHVGRGLLAWAERRLAPGERARVEAHLAACHACRAEADEMLALADTLGALPRALRALPTSSARSWPAVWARMQQSPLPRALPRLSFYLSLVGVVFALAAALPAGLGIQPLAVTAGVVETPVAPRATLMVSSTDALGAAALEAQAATAAWPIPAPTPIPNVKG